MYRRTIQGLGVGLAVAAGVLLAQAPASAPVAFEVATIRAAPPVQELIQQVQSGKAKVGMTVDGSRVDMGFSSLADLIRIAYDVKPYQIQGPEWMTQQRFEIQGRIPEGVSKDKVPQMLQALLADRFKMTVHMEKKELPIYALIVGKGGPKLTPAAAEPDKPIGDSDKTISVGTDKGQVSIARDGQNGITMQGAGVGTAHVSMGPNGIHFEMSRVTMQSLADTLTQFVGDKPVIDMTGLPGEYQIALDLPMEDMLILAQRQMSQLGIQLPGQFPGPAAGQAPTPGGGAILTAVDKLGLKLDSRKGPVDMIVIDHLEKAPTEN